MNRNRLKYVLICGLLSLPGLIHAAPLAEHTVKAPALLSVLLMFGGVMILAAAGYLSLSLIFSVLQPDLLRRSRNFIDRALGKNLLTGLLVFIVYFLLLRIINQFIPKGEGVRALLFVPILTALFIHGLIGFSMIAYALGDRIHLNINSRYTGSTFMAVFAGGTVLFLTGFIPLAGLVCLALAGLLGLGAATRAVTGIRRVQPEFLPEDIQDKSNKKE